MEAATNLLLKTSLSADSIDDVLRQALDLILSISWLAFEARGCIFVSEPGSETLKMAVERGLSDSAAELCAEIPFGTCMCGRAAELGEIQFADHVDERHDIRVSGPSHGHYCVPILVDGETRGVINVYVREGHRRNAMEEEFLGGIADTLALVLARGETQEALIDLTARMSGIVQAFDGLLYVSSPGHQIEFMNNRFISLIGRDPTGEICYKAIHDLDEPCPWCVNTRIFHGETVRWEVRMQQDGRDYDVVNRPIIHPDGSVSKLSMAIDITKRKRAEESLRHTVDDLESALEGTVSALASTSAQRDPYTALHQERVAALACAIASELELPHETVEGIRVAGQLHDIGKVTVPSEILSKPGTLSEMEMGIIRMHPTVGYELLKRVPFPWPVADIVLQHHERLDGSGYPDGVIGEDMLLEAKILAVADVIEAMSSHRPYRPAWGVQAALDFLGAGAGVAFDAEAVEACSKVVSEGTISLE